MSDAFKLHVPLDPSYRTLVPEVASRYAEIAGGSAAGAAALADALTSAIDRVTRGAGPHAGVDLSFRAEGAGVHVELSCNGHRESVNVKLPAATS